MTEVVRGFQEQDLAGLGDDTTALIDPAVAATSGRLVKNPTVVDRSTWPKVGDDADVNGDGRRDDASPDPTRESIRVNFRRADVYAVGGEPASGARVERTRAIDATRRQVLVPAAGREVLAADNADASADYRVLLRLGWDPAALLGLGGSRAEPRRDFEYAWTPSEGRRVSARPARF